MSVLSAADLASQLSTDKRYAQLAVDTVFKNDALIGTIIPVRPAKAGTGVLVLLVVSGNGSVQVYTEGQSVPDRGHQTLVAATFGFKHFRVFVGETGHARKARGPNGEGLLNGLDPDIEVTKALEDLKDLMTTTFLTDGVAYGLPGIVDATVNYGDLARGTYTTLKSYVLDAASAAVSTSLINKALYRSKEDPYKGDPAIFIAAPLQQGKIAELYSSKTTIVNAQGGSIITNNPTIGNAPLVGIPNLATDVLIGLSNPDRDWHATPNEFGNMGGAGASNFHVKYLGALDDSDTIQISSAWAVHCSAPHKQIKVDGFSTT